MKKVLICGLVCTLLLTGCGGKNNVLICTGTSDGGTTTSSGDIVEFIWDDEYKFTFDDSLKNVIKVEENTYAILSDSSMVSDVEQSMKDEFSILNESGMNVNISSNDNKVNLQVDYEVDNLTEEMKNEIIYINQTYDELKTYFEDEGYTCK